MKIWIDAQLSPSLAVWLREAFSVDAVALKELGLRDALDETIFAAARREGAIVMTKDADFVRLQEQQGAPPQIVWITCGNTSNARLRTVLLSTFIEAKVLLLAGEPLVEIKDAQ